MDAVLVWLKNRRASLEHSVPKIRMLELPCTSARCVSIRNHGSDHFIDKSNWNYTQRGGTAPVNTTLAENVYMNMNINEPNPTT